MNVGQGEKEKGDDSSVAHMKKNEGCRPIELAEAHTESEKRGEMSKLRKDKNKTDNHITDLYSSLLFLRRE